MKIIMTDQDGVVCNKLYKTTKEMHLVMQKIQQQEDVLIVPNSNTPIIRLINNFNSMIGLNPTITIGEDGAILQIKDKKIFTTKVSGLSTFKDELKNIFLENEYIVEIGDSSTWIKEDKKFKPNSKLLIIDSFREQSIGFFIKKSDKRGIAHTDQNLFDHGTRLIEFLKIPIGIGVWEPNPKYGIFTASAYNTTKTLGYQELRKYYPDADFFMIGDTKYDIINDTRVKLCAVGNAEEALKERSDFISLKPITEGFAECLEWALSM